MESDEFSDAESDEDIKKNDSGVDISNVKLPELPPSPIYGIMKPLNRIAKTLTKNFIPRKNKQPKITTTTTVYEDRQFYENSKPGTVVKPSTGKLTKRLSIRKNNKSIDPYENTSFHSPTTPTPITNSNGNTPSLKQSKQSVETSTVSNLSRTKSKLNKLQKSNVSDSNLSISSNNNNVGRKSQFYISDSVEPDSGIFSGSNDKIQQMDEKEGDTVIGANKTVVVTTYETPTQAPSPPRRKNKTNNYSPDSNRRKTTIGIRPNNPPPLPPNSTTVDGKKKQITSTWYTECGVFKPDTLTEDVTNTLKLKDFTRKDRTSTASWYTYVDAGLYQTSDNSVASSSGSSGVSTGGECCPGDDNSHSMFLNEPLYQIYNAAKIESITRDIEMEDEKHRQLVEQIKKQKELKQKRKNEEEEDGYEEVGRHLRDPCDSREDRDEEKKYARPTALQLVRQGPSRTLWCEIPEVINSGIIGTLSKTERSLQEAKFEILTSEASYLKSLNLLRSHFMNHPAFRNPSILTPENRKCMFSFITPVQDCSDRLLSDLESCWQNNIMLLGLSNSIYKHAERNFHVKML